jgi:RNA polymerase sigma factor (sigma-70 family)
MAWRILISFSRDAHPDFAATWVASHGGSLAEITMPFPALSAVVANAARSANATSVATSDGELLQQFVRTGEESAFGALVRRLGPMVLGVCRRVSRDRHLAEDAFQAAFVVLARRAADVRPAEAVRSWLYGVAVRTARGVRAVTARRLAREVPVPTVPDRAGEVVEQPDADALAILDEEVAGLPDHLRVSVVLCELDSLSRREAASRLGIAEGTLSSRLAKARKLLAMRLRKRGIAVPAAGLGMLVNSANVSARLVAKTSALATATAPLPPAVAALSNGVFRTMFFQKLTLGGVCGLLLVLAGLAAWDASPTVSAQEPPKQPVRLIVQSQIDDKKPAPAAKPNGAGRLIISRKGAFWVMSPDGKEKSELDPPKDTRPVEGAAISPDGKRVAYIVNTETGPRPVPADIDDIKPWPFKIIVRKLDKLEKTDSVKEWELPANHLTVSWTADGKKLIAAKVTNPHWTEYECVLLDPDTGKTEKLDIPVNARVLDCAKDGKKFLVQTYDEKKKNCSLGIATLGEKDVTALCDLHDRGLRPTNARFSPDGKTVLFIDADPERKEAHKWGCSQRVYVIDVAAKKVEPLTDFPDNGRAAGIAWSPDGKKIAYTWTPLDEEVLKKNQLAPEDVQKQTEGFLMIADADGRNAKTVASDKGDFALALVLGGIDWR